MISDTYCVLFPNDAGEAVAFYTAAFGALEISTVTDIQTGRTSSAELLIGNMKFMLHEPIAEDLTEELVDPFPKLAIFLRVLNAEDAIAQAVRAGATVVQHAKEELSGDRIGIVHDRFGFEWIVGDTAELRESGESNAGEECAEA